MINLDKIEEDYNLIFTTENKEIIKKHGKEQSVERNLDFVINELQLEIPIISRCPNILCRDYEMIKENYDYLKQRNIGPYDKETILHMLTIKPEELKSIIEQCERYQIPITPIILKRTSKEIAENIKICQDNNIPLTEEIFQKHPKDLENTISYVRNTYGEDYVLSPVVACEKKHIEKVFSYLNGKKSLDLVITNPNILRLTLAEIIERETLLHEISESFVMNNRFNPIFDLSRNSFKEKKNQIIESRIEK